MTGEADQELEDVLRTAHEWRERMARTNISAAEQRKFDAWRTADVRHGEMYDHAVSFYKALGTLEVHDLDKDVTRKSFWEVWTLLWDRCGRALRGRSTWFTAALGGIIAMSAAIIFFMTSWQKPQPLSTSPVIAIYETEIGETKEYQLSDGSTITLSAASAVETSFSKSKRTASLASGQALFRIAPDPGRPFVVVAGDLNATVLGTVFDVKRSGDLVHVAVSEGKVEVSYPLVVNQQPMSMRTRRKISVGEQVTAIATDGLQPTRKVNPATIASWRAETLYYDGASLSELLDDANRYSGRRVIIDANADKLSQFRVQGAFKTSDIDGMLSALPDLYPIRVDRSDPNVIRIRQSAPTVSQ